MKDNLTLTIMSLLTIVLSMIHLADDVFVGISPPGLGNLIGVAVFVLLLYGTMTLAGRRSGYIITLLGGIVGVGLAVIHMRGSAGMMGPHVSAAGHGFRFVLTLLAVSTTGVYTLILSVRGLWGLRAGRAR